MVVLVTGGAGFIGSALIRNIIKNTDSHVVNVDKLGYSANLDNLSEVSDSSKYTLCKVDICDKDSLASVVNKYKPNIIFHLAAESHVDRSILGPKAFIDTNIVGTFNLLEVSREYLSKSDSESRGSFRFIHISTDEVFGSLYNDNDYFVEDTSYKPNSPYSASKAASDHLVRAWYKTFNIPSIVTNCSNNYGPYQNPEKLIPLVIDKALNGQSIPVYGNGLQVRDWLFVDDHVDALINIASLAKPGTTYNIGGNNELTNITVVNMICEILDKLSLPSNLGLSSYKELITFVSDRPGHDIRYAIDPSKIKKELNWQPKYKFADGLQQTVKWYLSNKNWIDSSKAKNKITVDYSKSEVVL